MVRFAQILLLTVAIFLMGCGGGGDDGATLVVDSGPADVVDDSIPEDLGRPGSDAGAGDNWTPPADVPPGTEVCNGLDDDDDGEIDEAGAVGCKTYFKDLDKDGFGVATASICLCAPEKPFSALQKGDCDDLDPAISPKATEVCGNNLDEDCDGVAGSGDCTGKQCGDDGCGNSCGECGVQASCMEGQCIPDGCTPDCLGKECGDNGCGSSCGLCDAGDLCSSQGQCIPQGCVPQCDGYECGDDSCGGDCGPCGPNMQCAGHFCEPKPCDPDCAGKQCGADGCGGKCGSCGGQSLCVDGQCQCNPVCANKECGDDGCGGTCGACGQQSVCVGGKCQCNPDCANKECGGDGCGGQCGVCGFNELCVNFVCQEGPCEPNCVGKQCGDDGCQGSCGACGQQDLCVNGQCVPGGPTLPKIDFDPASPNKGNAVHVMITDSTPWAYVGLGGMGPCGTVESQWGGVDNDDNTWTWHYNTAPLKAGVHTFTFTANNGQEHVITESINVGGEAGCN